MVVDASTQRSPCRFLDNRGGLSCDAASTAAVVDSVFRGNAADNTGASHVASAGVSVWLGSTASIEKCVFEANRGDSAGALVVADAATSVSIDQTAFDLNAAHTTGVHAGGAIDCRRRYR